MCIAIWKPAGIDIDKSVLKTCYDNNRDGCGFAYINEDDFGRKYIKIKKTMDFDRFYKWYTRALRLNPDSPFIIHFRIATHGTVDSYNCHPFMIDQDHVFAHNGIIRKVGDHKVKSDTQVFNDEILKQLSTYDIMYNPAIQKLIEEYIGHTNKLIVMSVEGDATLFNEKAGNWHEGVWYSNFSWKPKVITPPVIVRSSSFTSSRFNKEFPVKDVNKTKWSWEKCFWCGSYHRIFDMTCSNYGGGDIVYTCKQCNPDLMGDDSGKIPSIEWGGLM